MFLTLWFMTFMLLWVVTSFSLWFVLVVVVMREPSMAEMVEPSGKLMMRVI